LASWGVTAQNMGAPFDNSVEMTRCGSNLRKKKTVSEVPISEKKGVKVRESLNIYWKR